MMMCPGAFLDDMDIVHKASQIFPSGVRVNGVNV